MKDENLDIDLIERFQEGKLTDEERQVFHQRLLEDEAFAKTVQLQLNITEEIETFWTNDMVTKIEKWEAKGGLKVVNMQNVILPNNLLSLKMTKILL